MREKVYYKTTWSKRIKNPAYAYRTRLIVTALIRSLGPQEPYFSLTYEETTHNHFFISGGAGLEYIVQYFPHLKRAARWHLSAPLQGPMHYEANAIYFAGDYEDKWLGYVKPNWGGFMQAAIVGALPTDASITVPKLTNLRDRGALDGWLRDRKPMLLKQMNLDMAAIFQGYDPQQLRTDYKEWVALLDQLDNSRVTL